MQILLLILQLVTIAILCFVLHQDKKIQKQLVSVKGACEDLYYLESSYINKVSGKGTYAVIKEWFDTHDCTAEYVKAASLTDAFLKCEPIDTDKGTIINIFKVD